MTTPYKLCTPDGNKTKVNHTSNNPFGLRGQCLTFRNLDTHTVSLKLACKCPIELC